MLRWRTIHPWGSVQDRGGCFWARQMALAPAERRRNSGFAGQSLRGRSVRRVRPQPECRSGAQPFGRRAVSEDECRDRGRAARGVE